MSNYIVPWNYITQHDVVPEAVLNVAEWFKTEHLSIQLSDWVGRPGPYGMNSSILAFFLGQGWTVTCMYRSDCHGIWETANKTESRNSSSQSGSSSVVSSTSSIVINSSRGSASNQSQCASNVNVQNTQKNLYWFSNSTVSLKRRKLNGEAVLQEMIGQFTRAYNEGRELNNQRYKDLVFLFSTVAEQTQADVMPLKDSFDQYKPLIEQIIQQMQGDGERFQKNTEGILEGFGDGQIARINLRFDNELAKARNTMISRGLFNTTVWESVSSGINRDREIALSEVKDRVVERQITLQGDIIKVRRDIADALHRAYIQMWEAGNKGVLVPVEMRNSVIKWLADFVERREDEYPDLSQISNITHGLGYANAGFSAG